MTELTPVKLLVVDLDDTIWHWFDPWHKSFSALLGGLAQLSGVPEPELIAEIRTIHQRHGTSEYSWLVDEMESLRDAVPDGMTPRDFYDDALHAQNSARREATKLRNGVRRTLEQVRSCGTNVVAYTESLEFWTRWRIRTTGVDGLLDAYYSSPDHDAPIGIDPGELRRLPHDAYILKHTEHRHVPRGVLKPSPVVLQQIITDHGVLPEQTVYVGDTLIKDVEMAQRVGARDVWAAYGVNHHDTRYELLQRVSHWTDEMVEREQDQRPGVQPTPTFVLHNSFEELLSIFQFLPTTKRRP
ncbi:hypothetical protein ASD19_07375 [Microbacterium sp. Root53]|uniref:HAD family hydrolase n=1 Tax=Microbacterium sp. Root53 TaxID=1736553 RepID=UPI0006F2943A|nr:HAD family hydrolase [Microbacterium sp. Root53]KQY98640.1 hypothetical protein ASD19_07375 [Microbacterium sp. Root53]